MQKKLALLAVVLISLAAAAFLVQRYASLETLAKYEDSLRQWLGQHRWVGSGIVLVVVFVTSMVPGLAGRGFLCGWLFGFWHGWGLLVGAMLAAAMASFALSRYVLRDYVQSKYERHLRNLNNQLKQHGAFYMLSLRMMHMPFAMVNYLAGPSMLRMQTFVWTTAVGILPSTMIFVYAGTKLPTLNRVQQQGFSELLNPWLIGALLLSAALPWTVQTIYSALE